MKPISNIDNEIESLKEIKDIRDEIRMIIKILKDQAMGLAEMDHLLRNHDTGSQERRSKLDINIREFEKMLRDADAVEDAV